MLVKVLAQEVNSFNICVNELIPGPVYTAMMGRAKADELGVAKLVDSEWFKEPEDLLPMALFLASQPVKGPTAQSFSMARREL